MHYTELFLDFKPQSVTKLKELVDNFVVVEIVESLCGRLGALLR